MSKWNLVGRVASALCLITITGLTIIGLTISQPALAMPLEDADAGTALDELLEHQGLWTEGCWQPGGRERFAHLIATVPDPLDSQFSRELDLTVGALRRGLEALGYVMDRHALPWSLEGSPSKHHRHQPGLLFFRRSEAASFRTLAVFLVGESPTSGTHDGALQQALDVVARLGSAADCSQQAAPATAREVAFKILAPFFSGSRYALRASLERWMAANDGTPVHIEMVSGTATSPENESYLEAFAAPALQDRQDSDPPFIDFESAASNDECLITETLQFLRGRLAITPGREATPGHRQQAGYDIAILAESSTYGSFFEQLPEALGSIVVLPFPMHISHLRSALDAQRERERKKQGDTDSASVLLGDQRHSAAAFPIFAPEPTARTLELALATIVRTITQQKVQAVGIIASDVRDKLYLAEIVRQHAPDVRLFTTEGDLLLAHPDFREGSRGMVVASSHSLRQPDPIQREGADARSVTLRFASDQAQGVFEAARALIQPDPERSLPKANGQECAQDEEVWISVIGNGDLWPLELRGSHAGASGVWRLPRGWLVLFSFVSACVLAVFVVLWLYFTSEGRDRNGEKVTFWQQWLESDSAGTGSRGRVRYLFLCLLSLLITCPTFMIAWPVLESSTGLAAVAAAVLLSILGVTSLGLLATLWLRTVADWRKAERQSLASLAAFAPFSIALSLTLALAVWLTRIALEPRSDSVSILLLERSVAISSGVSPMLPIILILMVPILWLLLSLTRHQALFNMPFLGHPATEGPRPNRDSGARLTGVDLKRLVDRVGLAIDPSHFFEPWRQSLVLLVFLFAPFGYLMSYHQVPEPRIVRSVETLDYDVFVSVGIGLAVLLVLGTFWRFAMGWRALSHLSDGLRNLRFDPRSIDREPLWWAANRDRIPAMVSATRGISLALRQRLFRRVQTAQPSPRFQTLELELKQFFPEQEAAPSPAELADAWEHVMELLAKRGRQLESGGDARVSDPERQPDSAESRSNSERDEGEDPMLVPARSFFATETAFFVSHAVGQLRQLLTFSTVGLVLILLTVSIYPFEPQRLLFLYVWSLVATTAAVGLYVLFQMERDEVISWISGSEPRKVGWDRGFILRFVSYAGLPILALLANHFPQIRDVLFQWVEPITKLFL